MIDEFEHFYNACRNKDIHLITDFINKNDPNSVDKSVIFKALAKATSNSEVEVIKILMENYSQILDTIEVRALVSKAVGNGNLDIIKYFIEESGHDIDITLFQNPVITTASRNGFLHILRYFIEDRYSSNPPASNIDPTRDNHLGACPRITT